MYLGIIICCHIFDFCNVAFIYILANSGTKLFLPLLMISWSWFIQHKTLLLVLLVEWRI